MNIRTLTLCAAVALALPTTQAGAAGLFDFGRSQAGQVDPEAVQAMADHIDALETDVVSLTAQVQELAVIVQQLQGQLKAAGVAPLAAAGPAPGMVVGPVPQLAMPPAATKPPTVAAIQPPGLIPQAAVSAPVAGVAPPLATSGPTASIGNGARLGPLAPDPSATLNGQPLDLSALARSGPGTDASAPAATASPAAGTAPGTVASLAPVPTAAVTATGDPKADYDHSYAFITSGKYDLAETSFRNFMAAYPKSDLAPDAQFWLGQSLFQRARYADAASVFRAGYTAYPKSPRAPDTLLALGQSLAGLGQRDEACQIYAAALKQHPTMPATLKQRVVTEQASAACPA